MVKLGTVLLITSNITEQLLMECLNLEYVLDNSQELNSRELLLGE